MKRHTKTYLVASFHKHFIGHDPATLKYVEVGLLDARIVKYELNYTRDDDSFQQKAGFIASDIANMCQQCDLSPEAFTICKVVIDIEPL